MSYRKSHMGANDRFLGDIGGDAARRQRDEEARAGREAESYEDGKGCYRTGGNVSLAEMLAGLVGMLVFLPGAVLGVVLFIKLIGSVTESWHVLGLVASFVVGGLVAMLLATLATAFAVSAVCRLALVLFEWVGAGVKNTWQWSRRD